MRSIGKKIIIILAIIIVLLGCKRFVESYPEYDSDSGYYFSPVYINGVKEEFHYEGGTFHIAAKESDVADREVEFLFRAGCDAPSAWELIQKEHVFLISKQTFQDGGFPFGDSSHWTRMRIGIHGNEPGEFRLLCNFGEYGKDVLEVKYGAFLEKDEEETPDPYHNFDELTVYVNGEPQTVNLESETLKATAAASHIGGGEIELLLPDWDCMTDFWWPEEENDTCYLLEAVKRIPNEVEDPEKSERFFPNLQKIRIGVKAGTEGEFRLSVKGLQDELHSVTVSYSCPKELDEQVPEMAEEQVSYESADQPGEMVVYVEGQKYTVSKDDGKMQVKADVPGIELVLPILKNQDSQWRYRDHHERDIAFQGTRTAIVRNSSAESSEYEYVQKMIVGSHRIGNDFELVTEDKETGEEIVLKLDWDR